MATIRHQVNVSHPDWLKALVCLDSAVNKSSVVTCIKDCGWDFFLVSSKKSKNGRCKWKIRNKAGYVLTLMCSFDGYSPIIEVT